MVDLSGHNRGERKQAVTYQGREVVIKFAPFPELLQGTVRGFLSGSVEIDYWLIGIDSTRHPLSQRHTLGHELCHLYMNHLNQHSRSIPSMEAEANRYAWDYYRAYKSGELETKGNATATERIRELNHRIWERDKEGEKPVTI